jgi:hypothetical protein
MSFSIRRTLPILSACLVPLIVTAGCGGNGSPIGPSGAPTTGAVIAGTMTSAQQSAGTASDRGPKLSRPAASPFAGLTVQVMGSNRSATVDPDGNFTLPDVPTGNVRIKFTSDSVNATITVDNVKADEFIQLQVQVDGTSAVVLDELREHKVSLCHAEGNGSYHLINVAESAEPAHRDHGDAEIGEPVPGRPNMIFDTNCRPAGPEVRIEKTTNGGDGEEIVVGTPITWRYVVRNTGTVALGSISVTDSRGVAVSCPSMTLAADASMTCTGTGTAVLGSYRNVGTVTAGFTFNGTTGTVTDADESSYLGIALVPEEEGQKVTLCHRTGAGFFVKIEVDKSAEPAHLAHGDGRPGGPVPGRSGSFTSTCGVQ